MSEVTTSSMHDARDAEDKRLLEAGEFPMLVESYYGVILDRCRARVWPEADAIGVAAEVAIRLLSELKRGRRYRVPFRVVFNAHRINVATSRAQCRVELVCSPRLLEADCRSIEEMRLVNALCRFVELAQS